ncbi:trimeric intracellular cation channel family protein [Psychrobacillus sp. NEAU-3TGS]|uniref:trimeric intracellular cation channel family protein n=1 Tax=Psychrobacillus sp. NEAU-3TGS TaxID=2995412 RepID=UPI002499983C|nr:trimeric intracellular cation channel family protein [Psychrobacillus sp. NEAU-3TGS]MDI2589174.1 trimeric intracellular cation channel family protein [Psychrobacillus sp. NEAU-3TGS]
MTWDILNIIGTIAFAISGVLIAIEEDYDLFGMYVLGFMTAFGGGLIRNILIGIPIENFWLQPHLFEIASLTITIAYIMPNKWIINWKNAVVFFDAIGLAAFAIQGANYAVSIDAPLMVVIIAAYMTGTGGGMIRDVFAGRKPMIFSSGIYAFWAVLVGLVIGFGFIRGSSATFLLLIMIVILRILSVYFDWNLPHKGYKKRMDN